MSDEQKSGSSVGQPKCVISLQHAIHCLEGRWKMIILVNLFMTPVMRYSELQRSIPNVSQKVLIQQLRGLESDGIILRTVHPEVPPRVEYKLSELGTALGPVFQALLNWSDLRNDS